MPSSVSGGGADPGERRGRRVDDVVVESGNGDSAGVVVQTADHFRQGIRRVEDGAAIGARMQIRRRTGGVDLEVREAA